MTVSAPVKLTPAAERGKALRRFQLCADTFARFQISQSDQRAESFRRVEPS